VDLLSEHELVLELKILIFSERVRVSRPQLDAFASRVAASRGGCLAAQRRRPPLLPRGDRPPTSRWGSRSIAARTAARPRALAYVGKENGTSASCSTGILAAHRRRRQFAPARPPASPDDVAAQDGVAGAPVDDQFCRKPGRTAVDNRPVERVEARPSPPAASWVQPGRPFLGQPEPRRTPGRLKLPIGLTWAGSTELASQDGVRGGHKTLAGPPRARPSRAPVTSPRRRKDVRRARVRSRASTSTYPRRFRPHAGQVRGASPAVSATHPARDYRQGGVALLLSVA